MKNQIQKTFRKIEAIVIEKNKSYGNAALHPLGIFYKGDTETSIRARIDEKLSRVKNNPGAFGENPIIDLVGHLILLLIAQEEKASCSKK